MTRQIKLQPKHCQLAHSNKIVPELKISGEWLKDLGFEAGQTVTITTNNRELIIKPCLR